MEDLYTDFLKWYELKFGKDNLKETHRAVLKLSEETGEVAKAFLKFDEDNLKEECADVFLVLLRIAHTQGFNLIDEAKRKLKILQKRLGKQ